jgi:hypothetical protein
MKKISYQMLQTMVLDGVELPKSEEYMASITIPYSEENEEIAKREAYNGEYTVEGEFDPEPEPPSGDSVWDELDAAYQRGVDSV